MKVITLGHDSPYLVGVKELWRKNSQTLGFFPEGAFVEHASNGWILAVLSDSEELAGYLLFRVVWRGGVWPKAVIVHLCVANRSRGKGIGRILVEHLAKLKEGALYRIELRCRRDFEADKIWPRFGFVYEGEIAGRAGILTKWQMELRCLPLLSLIEQNLTKKPILGVIDANVLYRLQDELPDSPASEKSLSEEAKALDADWIDDGIGLFLTDETLNEIQKNKNPAQRESRLSYLTRFAKLRTSLMKVCEAERQLAPFFTTGRANKSDIRQVAHAIAGKAHFFITQDTGLLKKADKLNEALPIKVLSPGEFISHLDERVREIEYEPKSLAGSKSILRGKVTGRTIRGLFKAFRASGAGERKNEFEGLLRFFLSRPDIYTLEIISHPPTGEHIILAAFDRANADEVSLPLLRISRSRIAETVLRYFLKGAVLACVKEGRAFIRIDDHPSLAFLAQAFVEAGFTYENKSWVKFNVPEVYTAANLLSLLIQTEHKASSFNGVLRSLEQALSAAIKSKDANFFSEVERQIWPGKISDANIRTYIIPIQPYWARNLFDEDLAKETLWGSQDHISLLLMNENVYYRSSRSASKIEPPARILWYVSKGAGRGSGCIRACSSLDEVIVGAATHLYRRFKRLGIYRWEDILKTSKGDPAGDIMALRFSGTQLLTTPVTLNELRNQLREKEGKSPLLQAPQRVTPASFLAIYSLGVRKAV